jgi:hypothetical protein
MTTTPRPRPATFDDLEPVRSALAEFRTHWTVTIPTLHEQVPCPFDGRPEDVDAIDYLDYEGLDYPPCGVAGAALVWGNVLAANGPFPWFVDGQGGLVLRLEGIPSIVIWPFGRVWESQNGGFPQDGKYAWLLKSTLGHALSEGDFCDEDETAMLSLMEWLSRGGRDYLVVAKCGLESYERLLERASAGTKGSGEEGARR